MKTSFFILFFVCLIFFCNSASADFISYQDTETAHLDYYYEAPATDFVKIELVADSVLVASSSSPTISGTYRHDGLSQGTHTYEYRIYTGSTHYVTHITDLEIDNTVAGYLLFDETISPETAGVEVEVDWTIVPFGKTLSFGNGNYSALSPGDYFMVSGTVTRTSGADTRNVDIRFYTTKSISDQSYAKFVFMPGSEGSTVSGGSYVNVRCESSVTINNVQHLQTILSINGGTWSVNNCTFDFRYEMSGGIYAYDSNFQADNCTVEYTELYKIESANNFVIEDTIFEAPLLLYSNITANTRFERCLFRNNVTLAGGVPEFKNCDFDEVITLEGRTGADFSGNIFFKPVSFSDELIFPECIGWGNISTPSPTFYDNDFIGKEALKWEDYSGDPAGGPIEIGFNYFGDPDGPSYSWPPTNFMCGRGAYVMGSTGAFNVATPNSFGDFRRFSSSFPKVWLCSIIMGQTTLDHHGCGPMYGLSQGPLVQNRDTLICIDLACTEEELGGVKVYAEINGQKYYSTAGEQVKLYRDPTILLSSLLERASQTVNIIVPPLYTNDVTVKIFTDTTGVTGYDETGTVEQVLSQSVFFRAPPRRPLGVLGFPINLHSLTFGSGAPSPNVSYVDKVKEEIATRLPIASSDIIVKELPTFDYYNIVPVLGLMLDDMALEFTMSYHLLKSLGTIDFEVDFTVAVFKNGLLGAEGANMPVARKTVFVDEKYIDAIIHEMGHGIGLYTGLYKGEQYDKFPPSGIKVNGATMFVPETKYSLGKGFGDQGRIHHVAVPELSWYKNNYNYDVMGNMLTGSWGIPDTINSFLNYFASLSPVAQAKESSLEPTRSGPPDVGKRRIYMKAKTEFYGDSGTPTLRLKADAIRTMEITDISSEPIVPEGVLGDYYYFETFDSSDAELDSIRLWCRAETNATATGYCSATFDIDESAVRYHLWYRGDVIYEQSIGEQLINSVISPAPGTPIGNSVTITWTATVENVSASAQPLQHMVFYSTDNGINWSPIGPPTENFSYEFPGGLLNPSNTVAFKVVSSEGFQCADSLVGNLTVENRPPGVEIISPIDGEEGFTNVLWEFIGSAYDIEDKSLTNGTWNSSLDGFLGTDNSITTRVLSVGSHTLTYIAQDSEGLAATANVNLTVTALETIDLSVVSNMLTLGIPGRSYEDTSPLTLVTGESHTATLVMRNVGRYSDYTAELYLETPSAGTFLLASENVSNAFPFENNYLVAEFVPSEKGPYKLIGLVTNALPADRDLNNNIYNWSFSSLTPPNLFVVPSVNYPDSVISKTLVITNSGEQSLTIGQLAITGDYAYGFTFVNDNCSGESLNGGEFRSVDLSFVPTQTIEHTAFLLIPSGDPVTPDFYILLTGIGIPEPGFLWIIGLLEFWIIGKKFKL